MFITLTEQAFIAVKRNLKTNLNEKLFTIYPAKSDRKTKEGLKQAISGIDGYVEISKNAVTKITSQYFTYKREKSVETKTEYPAVKIFSWSDGAGGIEVTTRSYDFLNEGAWVNDNINDFYLRYVLSKKTEPDRSKFNVFSVFFYVKLATRPKKQVEADIRSPFSCRGMDPKYP